MRRMILLPSLLGALVFTHGCGLCNMEEECNPGTDACEPACEYADAVEEEPWLEPPPDFGIRNEWRELPSEQIFEVALCSIPEAEAMLEDAAAVQLNLLTASRFVGTELSDRTGLAPYLVRGVLISLNGAFEVFTQGTQLYVAHGSLATFTTYRRQPLVLFLDAAPETVYVYASAIE